MKRRIGAIVVALLLAGGAFALSHPPEVIQHPTLYGTCVAPVGAEYSSSVPALVWDAATQRYVCGRVPIPAPSTAAPSRS